MHLKRFTLSSSSSETLIPCAYSFLSRTHLISRPSTSNSYWRMAGVLGRYITNEALEMKFGLIPIDATWDRLHNERMMRDKAIQGGEKQLVFDFG